MSRPGSLPSTYSERRPLSEADRSLIDLLDDSGQVLGGLNWLRWLYLDRRDMGPLPPIFSASMQSSPA